MSSIFKVEGKFAGLKNGRTTPGGIILEDLFLSVSSDKLSWKQERSYNIPILVWGDLALSARKLKSGDIIKMEGVIESYQETPALIALKLQIGGK